MSKEQYWKNRAVGRRGQGEYPSMVVRSWTPEEWQAHQRELRSIHVPTKEGK